jgi:hypothetical protein
VKFAYADPPYPGQSKRWYGGHPDYGGEVDHAELIGQLCRDYPDGWALSTSAIALRDVLILCPPDVQVAIWHVTSAEPPGFKKGRWHRTWEPVIVRGGRADGPVIRNLLACGALTGGCNDLENHSVPGQKPSAFCRWVFGLLGAGHDDELDDLFPGSGAVGRAWESYRAQPWLPAVSKLHSREAPARRERRLAREGAPTLMDQPQ